MFNRKPEKYCYRIVLDGFEWYRRLSFLIILNARDAYKRICPAQYNCVAVVVCLLAYIRLCVRIPVARQTFVVKPGCDTPVWEAKEPSLPNGYMRAL